MEKSYEVRKVSIYNPYDDLIACRDVETGVILSTVEGEAKLCLPTVAQEKWFWLYCQENNINGRIVSTPVRSEMAAYEFETHVYMGDDEHPVSSGHAFRLAIDGVTEKFPPYETAETMSRSRALSAAGFGPEIAVYLKKRDEENLAEKAKQDKAVAEDDATKAKSKAEDKVKSLTEKKAADPFAKAGIKPPVATTPADKPAEPEEKEPEKTEEPKEPEADVPAEKAEEKPKEEPKKPAKEKKTSKKKEVVEPFKISLADTGHVPSIRGYAGKDIDSLSKDVLTQILSRFETKISPAFAEAIKARI